MHDTIRLERKGIPSVVLVHDRFERAAKSQAKIMGLPSTKIIVIPEDQPGEDTGKIWARMEDVWDQIVRHLAS